MYEPTILYVVVFSQFSGLQIPSQTLDEVVSGGTLVKKCQIQHLVVPKSPFEYRAAENSFHLYSGKKSFLLVWFVSELL